MIYIDDSEPDGALEPAFPYRDVTIKRGVDANDLYEILGEVGRGKFGTVYKCREKATNLKLAAKFVPIPKREDRRSVEREVEIMNSLQHHLIIQLYAAYEYQKMMCVVLELVEGGELFDRVIDDEFVLTERVCVMFIRQVCEAMEFIHRNNILHLDLKPENILCLTQEGNRIKIIDFGLARKYDPNKKLQILFGTPEFVAPEVVNFDCISYGTDMWSVGVICYVLISGLSPFMGETDIETMANVTIAKYDFEDESFSSVSPECLDFIAKLLVKDLNTRMTAAQCLEHKWLQRRPKTPPSVAPKQQQQPAAPPSLKAKTSQQEIDLSRELETTKDNLKNFIERWEEHPNSPYVFDVEGNVIAPLSDVTSAMYLKPNGGDSISSSRVCSPSPCESIGINTDDDDGVDVYDNPNEDDEFDDDRGNGIATPVNESRERLYHATNGNTASGMDTPTPTPTAAATPQPTATQLFASKLDELSGSGGIGGGFGSSANLHQRSLKSYLHTFDRRNSDTNYLLGRRSSGERVNLADEIRKLSDHLLMLAEINTKLGSDAANEETTATTTTTTTHTHTHTSASGAASDNNKKAAGVKSSMITQKKQKKTTLNKSSLSNIETTHTSVTETTSSSSSSALSSSSSSSALTNASSDRAGTSADISKTKLNPLSLRLQQTIEATPKILTNDGPAASRRTSAKKRSSTSTNNNNNNTINTTTPGSSQFLLESASSRRAKFRINQMSRDVPIGLPDTHQTVNLEQAANTTKDCLLHLLEKYNETKVRNPLGRHQSISVDCNISDNLEYRSMSSINAFFQRHNNSGQNVKQLQAHLQQKAWGK